MGNAMDCKLLSYFCFVFKKRGRGKQILWGDLVTLVDKVQNASLQDVYLVFFGEFP